MGDAYHPRTPARRSAGQGSSNRTAPYFPILTKLLFVSETLSVQVHPGDEYALEREGGPGKTEMWYVTAAEPSAAVCLGLTEPLGRERMIQAAESGEIERYLNWTPVEAGDVIFVPPGLLHTVGAGVTICEIQQNSDLTYRFFDFNRVGSDGQPRPLHIRQAAEVTSHDSKPGPTPKIALPHARAQRELLAACRYFAAERLAWDVEWVKRPDRERFEILIVLEGEGEIAGQRYKPGEAYLIPAHGEAFAITPRSRSMAVLAYEPDLGRLRAELEQVGAEPEVITRTPAETGV
jgi:mannose-6-phosphate isomerase